MGTLILILLVIWILWAIVSSGCKNSFNDYVTEYESAQRAADERAEWFRNMKEPDDE